MNKDIQFVAGCLLMVAAPLMFLLSYPFVNFQLSFFTGFIQGAGFVLVLEGIQ